MRKGNSYQTNLFLENEETEKETGNENLTKRAPNRPCSTLENTLKRAQDPRVALSLKKLQWKGKDEEEAGGYVERLRDQCTQDNNRSTVGWIYNASGSAITLVGSRDWEGGLASSSLYPVRIENGQWGVFLPQQTSSQSSGSVLYKCGSDFCWCVAWMNKPTSSPQVHVCLERRALVPKRIRVRERKFYWSNYILDLMKASLERFETHQTATQNGLFSVISSGLGPHVVFEALLTMENVL